MVGVSRFTRVNTQERLPTAVTCVVSVVRCVSGGCVSRFTRVNTQVRPPTAVTCVVGVVRCVSGGCV